MEPDEEWDKHFKDISQKDWNKLMSDALKYWDELDDDNDIIKNDSDEGLESGDCPMHPNVFLVFPTLQLHVSFSLDLHMKKVMLLRQL